MTNLELAPGDHVQGRSLEQWIDIVNEEIARHDDHALCLWLRRGLSEMSHAVKWEDWHPSVQREVGDTLVRRLRLTDPRFVPAAVRFALCTGRFWSEERLFQFVCQMAGFHALSEYLTTLDDLTTTNDEEPPDDADDTADGPDNPPAGSEPAGGTQVGPSGPGPSPTLPPAGAALPVSAVSGEDQQPPGVALSVPSKSRRRRSRKPGAPRRRRQ